MVAVKAGMAEWMVEWGRTHATHTASVVLGYTTSVVLGYPGSGTNFTACSICKNEVENITHFSLCALLNLLWSDIVTTLD